MRTTSKAFVVAGAIFAAILMATPALAAELRHGEQAAISGGEHLLGDAYIAGGSVTGAGAVDGDLYAAGGNVVLSGAVGQDVTVVGGNLTIIGPVGDDLRAAGGTVIVGGEVKGDVVIGAGQVTITAPVGGDVIWGGGMLRIDAPVAGNLVLGGGEVVINAPIAGSVRFDGGKLTLGSAAAIGGDLKYRAEEEAKLADGATVGGAVSYDPRPKTGKGKMDWKGKPATAAGVAAGLAAFAMLAVLLKILMTAVAALVLGLVFRRRALALMGETLAKPLSALGLGFVALIVTPAAAILLLVTVVGIPLAALVGLGYAVLMILARIAVPILAGSLLDRWVMRRKEYRITWATILVGALATLVLGFIPILGWLALGVLCLIAFGALAKATWEGVRGMAE